MFDFFGGGDYIDVFEEFKKEDARQISEYKKHAEILNNENCGDQANFIIKK